MGHEDQLTLCQDFWVPVMISSGLLRSIEARRDLMYQTGPTLTGFHESSARLRCVRSPNRIGKSMAGAWEAVRHSLDHPGSIGCVLIADLDNHYTEVCETVRKVMADSELDAATRYVPGRGYYRHGMRGLAFENGSRWVYRTGMGQVMALAGATYDWLWIDEVPQESHFTEALRGLATTRGPCWITFTPIGRPVAWLRRLIEGDPETGEKPEAHWEQYVPSLCVDECPWRTPDDIEEQIALVPHWERPQRIHGAWEGPTGHRKFEGYIDQPAPDGCLLPGPPTGSYSVVVTMDHGEGIGREGVLLIYYDSTRIVVVDEYLNTTASTPAEDMQHVIAMLRRHRVGPMKVDRWVGDVNSAGKSAGEGRSVNDEMEVALAHLVGMPNALPIKINKPKKPKGSVALGERLVNHALLRRDLLVCERCVKLRESLLHYTGKKETPDLSHLIDALRYGVTPILLGWHKSDYSRLVVGY